MGPLSKDSGLFCCTCRPYMKGMGGLPLINSPDWNWHMDAVMTELPQFVQIEPVGRCNLRCRMCPVQYRAPAPSYNSSALIKYDDYCRLINQFEGMTELHLQGMGEPLLHPRFFDMVRFAARRGVRVTTNTNLTALAERQAAECVNSGLHTLHVSIDAASPEPYESIRVKASLDKVLRNLERLSAAKRMFKSDLPHVSLVAVLMRLNLGELPALVRLASVVGAESLSVQNLSHDFDEPGLPERYRPMHDFIEEQKLTARDRAQVLDVFEQARSEAARLGIRLRLPSVEPRERSPDIFGVNYCDWPWRGAYVSYDGKAMPCCMVSTPDRIHFGDMSNEGVKAVWSGAAYEEFRRRLASGDPPDICRGCSVYRGTF